MVFQDHSEVKCDKDCWLCLFHLKLLLDQDANQTQLGCVCSYDVNVTPDKRKVFLHHEAEVLQALQEVILTQSLTHLLTYSLAHSLSPPPAHLDGTCALAPCDMLIDTHPDMLHCCNIVQRMCRCNDFI